MFGEEGRKVAISLPGSSAGPWSSSIISVSARQILVLGTASQAPTRQRSHNSCALRWDDQLVLFDPGEGTQRQCIFGGVSIARATAVCITHFHGDHCLGLPGVIQRRALDARTASVDPSRPDGLPPLPIFFPADGWEYLERLRSASIYHDTSNLRLHPISSAGPVAQLGPLTVSAGRLDHRVTAFGYRFTEQSARRFDPRALAHFGIAGPDVARLELQGVLSTDRGPVTIDQVSVERQGQSMAFVMDTRWCDAAIELARGVDLLVCESTFLDRDEALAQRFGHLTAGQAGKLAAAAGARRLLLTHFSARYGDNQAFAEEASRFHPDVVAADDLAVIDVPPRLP